MTDPFLIAVAVITLGLVGVVAYRAGRPRSDRAAETERLEGYEFYPFTVDENRHIQVDLALHELKGISEPTRLYAIEV